MLSRLLTQTRQRVARALRAIFTRAARADDLPRGNVKDCGSVRSPLGGYGVVPNPNTMRLGVKVAKNMPFITL